jgi:hypothetical protein
VAGLAGPWYVSWAWFVVPLVAVFAIAGSLSGSVVPVSRRVFWRVVVVLNVLFLVWTGAPA